jgi:hypothetical protein
MLVMKKSYSKISKTPTVLFPPYFKYINELAIFTAY